MLGGYRVGVLLQVCDHLVEHRIEMSAIHHSVTDITHAIGEFDYHLAVGVEKRITLDALERTLTLPSEVELHALHRKDSLSAAPCAQLPHGISREVESEGVRTNVQIADESVLSALRGRCYHWLEVSRSV